MVGTRGHKGGGYDSVTEGTGRGVVRISVRVRVSRVQ